MGEPFLVKGILDKVRLHQPLEEATLVRFGIGNGPDVVKGLLKALSEEISRSEFSTGDRDLGRPELTPLGKCSGAVELEIVP